MVPEGIQRVPETPLHHPARALFGLTLLCGAWIVSWGHLEPLSTYAFFPLWLGYILFVDGVVFARRGTSLLAEGLAGFVRIFLASALVWWGFELLNTVVHNWRYAGTQGFSAPGYFLFASVAFSTVIPAVLETATLLASFLPGDRFCEPVAAAPQRGRLAVVAGIGVLTFATPFLWPREAYAMLWVSALLIVEPLNWLLNRPSLFRLLAAGRIRLILVLGITGWICGPLWELWNYHAYPKWYYALPGITGPKFFEMPLPGMLGYPPFMLEVYAVYNLLLPLVGRYSAFERVLQAPRLDSSLS
jgi:hypothetical protein